MRATVGIVLGVLGDQGGSRPVQILGIVAVILSVVSIAASGLAGAPQ